MSHLPSFGDIRQHSLRLPLSTPLGDVTLLGYSRAADGTAFVIPELDIGLDAGRLIHTRRPRHLFIPHTPLDHVSELPRLKSRRTRPGIYAPVETLALLDHYIESAQRLTDAVPDRDAWQELTPSYDLIGAAPGERLTLPGRGQKRLRADVVRCHHTVPCVGYRLLSIKKRLKEEHRGLPGAELARLRKAGVAIEEEIEEPLLTFLGDTTPQVFRDHPEVLEDPIVLVECTFIGPDHHAQAAKTGHTHWDELEPFIHAHPDTRFILTHGSHRYSDEELRDFFAARLPDNAVAWVPPLDVAALAQSSPSTLALKAK